VSAPLFDSHCHLDFESFGADLDAVLARAAAAGVTRIASIGSGRDVESAHGALRVARAHPGTIVATAGIHPHDARVVTPEVLDEIGRIAREPEVVAVGEIGLDYHYDHSPRETQREVFRQFIALARALRKPIIVHTREAPADTLAVLREESARDVGGVIHCFSEDPAFARDALDLGFVSSFSGIVTFKNATAVREAARTQPLDAILVETDAPFLAPVPYRGKRNEPAWVAHTAAEIARLRGMPEDELCARTTENACKLYGIPLPPAP